MKRTMVALGLVGLLALTAATAFAWGPGWGRGFGPFGYGPGAAALNLSEEQVAKILKIQGDQYAEMSTLQNEMFTKGLAARTAIAEVLTPEQRAQFPAFGQGAGPGFGPGFGPGRGFGPGMGMGPMGMGARMGFDSPR